uniref:Ribosome biogenesis regulatory protein n=1 Tax=Macrostomum lignano TaxID=282301 RepID=A0A1I8H444_9PLAT
MSVLATSVPPTFDLGLLLINNPNPLDPASTRGPELEPYLAAVARENAQSLLSEIWQRLPAERVEDAHAVAAGEAAAEAEAAEPLEEFARLKSIRRNKKEQAVWDEATGEWRPRWGYGRADPSKEWLLEVPASADPNEDQFGRLKKEKKERVAKNELQRLKNISRNMRLGGTLPALSAGGGGATSSSKELKRALVVAKRSDASVGQFSAKVGGEKVGHLQGRRRHFLPNTGSLTAERGIQEQVLKELAARRTDPLNTERAVNRLQQQREQSGDAANAVDGRRRPQKKKTAGKVSTEGGKSRRQNARDSKSRKYKKAAASGRANQKMKSLMKSKTLGKRK